MLFSKRGVRNAFFLFTTLLAFNLGALARAAEVGKNILAIVDDKKVTRQDVDILSYIDPYRNPPGLPPEKRTSFIVDYLVDLHLLSKEAADRGLYKDPRYKKARALMEQRAAAELLIQDEGRKAVTDQKLKEFYEKNIKKIKSEKEVHARHILLKTQKEADAAYKRAKSGESFADLAMKLSKDPGSAKNGGDLGYFTKNRMVKPFAEKAFSLKSGQISKPVKTDFGWHVIKVEDQRNTKAPDFKDVKNKIESYLKQKAQKSLIEMLRSKSSITRFDKTMSKKKN